VTFAKIRTEYIPNTGIQRYDCTNLLLRPADVQSALTLHRKAICTRQKQFIAGLQNKCKATRRSPMVTIFLSYFKEVTAEELRRTHRQHGPSVRLFFLSCSSKKKSLHLLQYMYPSPWTAWTPATCHFLLEAI
jgi:hypothetical protein